MKSAPVRPVGIVVLGMHRSGTSLLTRVLNLLGCALPKNLLGAHESNPRGHWESLDAIEINDTLLSALGRRWDDVRELPVDWLDRAETEVARQRIRSMLEREFSHRPLWVLKEPRLCRLAPLWLEVIASLEMDARVIVPVRHPREVSLSLARRNDLDAGRSHLLWWQHLVEAERASRNVPRTFLHFHSLVTDWRAETDRMATELGLKWPGRTSEIRDKIDRFIDPKLRHADALAHAGSESVQAMPALVESLYAHLLELRGPSVWKAIASADAELDTVRSLYAPAIEGLAMVAEKADRHAAAVDAVLSSNLVDRQNLVLDTDQVRLLREQSYGILDKIEQSGPLIVELVKQIEAQRSELATLTARVLGEITTLAGDHRGAVEASQAGQQGILASISARIGDLTEVQGQALLHLSEVQREALLDLSEQRLDGVTVVSDAIDTLGKAQAESLASISTQQNRVAEMVAGLAGGSESQRAMLIQLNKQLHDEALAQAARIDRISLRLDDTAVLLREAVQRNQDLTSRLSTVEGALAEKIGELEVASAKLAEMETALAESELVRQVDRERHSLDLETLASFERESASLRRAIALTNQAVARYEGQLGQARAATESLQARLDSGLAERYEAQQRLDALASEASMQKQTAMETAERLAMHEQQLAAIERSRSWRLTAPLRALVRSLKSS